MSDVLGSAAHAVGVSAELLPEGDRHGILQMRPARLQDVRELVRFVRQAFGEDVGVRAEQRGAEQQRQARRRRKHVVRRLAHVHVVVRMHASVRASRLAEDLAGAIRQHLVRVHVVRRAGARLVYVDDELIAESAAQDFIGGVEDGGSDVPVQPPQRGIGFGRGLLHEDGRDHEIRGRPQAADGEVLDGALGLHPVVRVGGNRELTKRVAFSAEGHEGLRSEV